MFCPPWNVRDISSTLESGINVPTLINVPMGKCDKNNKHTHWIKHTHGTIKRTHCSALQTYLVASRKFPHNTIYLEKAYIWAFAIGQTIKGLCQ